VSDVAEAAGSAQEAIALLRAARLGQDPCSDDVDRSLLRPPDADALRLLRVLPEGDDEAAAVELFVAAGYDDEYALALVARFPDFAPDPALVRRLLAEVDLT
jgi:hypothetical protein